MLEDKLRLHPLKCSLFAIEIRWFGRKFSENGNRYDPRNIEGLLRMNPPTCFSQLQQCTPVGTNGTKAFENCKPALVNQTTSLTAMKTKNIVFTPIQANYFSRELRFVLVKNYNSGPL